MTGVDKDGGVIFPLLGTLKSRVFSWKWRRSSPDLVLDEVKLQMLHHITDFTDEELKEALDAVAAEQAKKRAKRKKK